MLIPYYIIFLLKYYLYLYKNIRIILKIYSFFIIIPAESKGEYNLYIFPCSYAFKDTIAITMDIPI